MMKKLLLLILFFPVLAIAQINTDRVMMIARNALYFEDYVLSIQYFNQIINAKPYLYEPYYYRGVAKINLDDFSGAENDCSEALSLNPFVVGAYQIRGLARIRLNQLDGAIEDYRTALKYDPENTTFWHNLTLCHLQKKDYKAANEDLDKLLTISPKYTKAFMMRGEIALQQKDTVQALKNFDKTIELDKYDQDAYISRGSIKLAQNKYKEADGDLSEAIKLNGKIPGLYINRALARFHLHNLRGTMNDYNLAVDLDPNNFIAHYNRGLLRAQVGDDNRAIEDFNFVLKIDPADMMATFNRGLLRQQTGDYRGAIRDYTTVIKRYPNFLVGYSQRAAAKRKIGDKNGAELDEFKIFKMQMGQGIVRGKRAIPQNTRKKSDKDINNYQKIVIADDNDNSGEHYKSDYRGKVQNKNVVIQLEPLFVMSYYEKETEVSHPIRYYKYVDKMNSQKYLSKKLLITNSEASLSENQVKQHFKGIDDHTLQVAKNAKDAKARFARGMDFYIVQDFTSAIEDFTQTIVNDDKFFPAYFMRAVARFKELDYKKSEMAKEDDGKKESFVTKKIGMSDYDIVKNDLAKVIELAPDFQYGYYNLANLQASLKDYKSAVVNYNKAIALDKKFAEAYFNRGLTNIYLGNNKQGISDLSKAGELGIASAYNIIKRFIDKAK
jgi:tetratricopeptide (TPR) repeat protein